MLTHTLTHTHTHTHTHTPAERTPRDSTTNLILCWHTVPQLCHAFTALSLLMLVSQSERCIPSYQCQQKGEFTPGQRCVCVCVFVCVYFVPAAHLLCKPQLPTGCTALKNTVGVCRSSHKVALRSSDGFSGVGSSERRNIILTRRLIQH